MPDLSICSECLNELTTKTDRRYNYPFINCTQCGPRYSIIIGLPYDRNRTTMNRFKMCAECEKEYHNPNNRRFHAEPIACPECGPSVRLLDRKGIELKGEPFKNAAELILKGKILAIKGLGGFHLCCDATNTIAVLKLRQKKGRDRKPLALMVQDIDTVRQFCRVPKGASALLRSPASPIVLLPKKEPPDIPITPSIAPDNPSYGVMLAYTPLHLILFQKFKQLSGKNPVLVMTSANFSEEPIAKTDEELYSRFRDMFEFVLTHNRPIANRCDDSVIKPSTRPIMVRRSRGYAPQPIRLGSMFHVKHPTLAVGGDGKNCFALGYGDQILFGPHIGELDSVASEGFFMEALSSLINWSGIKPEMVICDLHPDYRSTALAQSLARRYKAKLYQVQHHYAHILSVMAEHGVPGPVIGFAADGTGYGVDGAIWGCELLIINKDLGWRRIGHLNYLKHSAGAGMVADPVKLAVSYLSQSGITVEEFKSLGLKLEPNIKNLRITTSSLGRLFDAAAGITGICRKATFEGEPAIALEAAALKAKKPARVEFDSKGLVLTYKDRLVIDPRPLLVALFKGRRKQISPSELALWFHQILGRVLSQAIIWIARTYRIGTVCLSGGSMQNDLLRLKIIRSLTDAGLKVFYNQTVPLNDGGIALGQIVVPV